jgi:hypothetical protein
MEFNQRYRPRELNEIRKLIAEKPSEAFGGMA